MLLNLAIYFFVPEASSEQALTQKSNKKGQGIRKMAKKDFITLQRKSLNPGIYLPIDRGCMKYF